MLNKYKLTYWPDSGSLQSDWHKDIEMVDKLERIVHFEATEKWAKERAKMTFLSTNSDGVELLRYTMDSECNWFWELVK